MRTVPHLPLLTIRTRDAPPLVTVTRGDGVPDTMWLRALAEWGASGSTPQRSIVISQDLFLGRCAWLPDACRRHGVGLDHDARTRELISRQRVETAQLTTARTRPLVLTAEEVTSRLSGSRFNSGQLRHFQLRDLGRLLGLPHGANFSVPGAAKTAVTYALYEVERQSHRVARMLVIAPLSAFEAWRDEADKWIAPTPIVTSWPHVRRDTEVLLVNYQRLAAS